MKKFPKKYFSIMLVLLILVSMLSGCANAGNTEATVETSAAAEPVEEAAESTEEAEEAVEPAEEAISSEYPMDVEELGSGDVKWTETQTTEGWAMVTNEDGTTLGYTKGSGLELIQVDGYAFKDLNKNGKLDKFEDWRVDAGVRAASAAEELSTEQMMGLRMNPMLNGTASADAIDDTTKSLLDLEYRDLRAPRGSSDVYVGWNNLIQEYIEGLDLVIPATYIADPLSSGVSQWPTNLGMASTFDPEVAAEYGRLMSEEWRALGISVQVATQIDLATEPRWKRITGTFGEDPALASDMSVAIVNAWQSSYDENGEDLGWGEDSVVCQIKHLTGDGAAEGGRESHTLDGAYTVFPGGQFYTQLMPFVATLNLPGKTETAAAAMTNFSIAVDENGDAIGDGGRVVTSLNSWKINTLWREAYGFDGYIITDFGVIFKDAAEKTIGNNRASGRTFGAENLTPVERYLAVMEAGVDAFGGEGDSGQPEIDLAMEAYALGVEKLGQEAMDKIMLDSAVRTLKTLFLVGVVDNPYLSNEYAAETANSEEHNNAGYEAMLKSIIMLKNSGNLIKAASEEMQTVYIPWKFVPETTGYGGVVPASWAPMVNLETAAKYYNVVTDQLAETLTGPNDANGNPTATENDIVRASVEEVEACDFAIVKIQSPQNGNPTSGYAADSNTVPEDFVYLPISLQYRPYTADSDYVRLESIGGQLIEETEDGVYGAQSTIEKENRSYFGQTGIITNESDLDLVLYTASVVNKVVVAVDWSKPMVFSEFESEVDAIVIGSGVTDAAFLDIISGKVEPSGLLPMQMPKNMETVEAQYEDVPRDMECYVDSEGNTYDFTFGLNWAGVISDARTAKYNVAPLVGENPFE